MLTSRETYEARIKFHIDKEIRKSKEEREEYMEYELDQLRNKNDKTGVEVATEKILEDQIY